MKKSWIPAVRSTWPMGLIAVLGLAGIPPSPAATPSPVMAPLSDYLMADRAAEIALARSAAPPSISGDAEVLVLDSKGYVSGAPGKNGFVCMVQRSWFSGLQDDGFWAPKLRAPICFNPQSARSVLPVLLTRTTWAMSGVSQAEMLTRTRAAMADGKIPTPEAGSITFMMSKEGHLGSSAGYGPWRPHLMFFLSPMRTADWGANMPSSPVAASEAGVDPYTMFYIPGFHMVGRNT